MKPILRFKEFSEDWCESTLGDISTFKQGIQVDVDKQFSIPTEDSVRFIRIVDYTQNTKDVRYITKPANANYVDEHDVVLVRYGATAGFVGHGIVGVIANNMFTITPNEKIDRDFLYTFLKQEKIYKKLNSSNGSSAMPALNFGTVSMLKFRYPSLPEQKKLTNLISLIDKKIELHKQYLDELKKIIQKTYIDVFEKKVRFKEFNSDWKNCSLKELIEYIADNRGRNPDYYTKEGIPVIDNFMIKNNLYPDLTTANRYIDEDTYEKFIRKRIENDDVLITLVGNGIGNITLAPKEKSVIIQNTLGLRANKDINKRFIYHCLFYNNKNIKLLDRGMAQPSIRQDELLNLNLFIPSDSDEIDKITKLFDCFSRKIELEAEKISYLEEYKKGLMQNMFV